MSRIDGLGQLRKLHTLYLVHNRIERIEVSACVCARAYGAQNLTNNTALRLLELGNNKIKVIENVGHLIHMEKLYLGANRISKIEGK